MWAANGRILALGVDGRRPASSVRTGIMGDTAAVPEILRKESTQAEARVRFIDEWLAEEHESIAKLCEAHGVSRKTGYKWITRFREKGLSGLADEPIRWKKHPGTTPTAMVEQIVVLRKKHPTWGPKKIVEYLSRKGYKPPAKSTIGAILLREACIRPKRRRERPSDYSDGLTSQDEPNAVCSRAGCCEYQRVQRDERQRRGYRDSPDGE